ncbi:hypothetical protein BDDG_03070 [Blastomyces dermatitidis ATCC 18188]|uniref:Transcription regulator Rua1 C-terminal domain-containing protein n=1 Tax=Ajellomyces dermatitidis (strain ATCC 18188 / CBS 674.68) TaxID=653446 RepID=F2TA66_AJEDA|nr:hypothetical protein BDDG_03070 [Blastomyces dermatitidis ATCC 18188]
MIDMSSNDINYTQVGPRNSLPSTLISSIGFPPPTPGSSIQVNNIDFGKVLEDGNMATRNMANTTLNSCGPRAWDIDNQPNPKTINDSVYSLPYTPQFHKTPACKPYEIRMPSQYVMPAEFGTPPGLLGINALDDRFDDQHLVEELSTFSGIDHNPPLFPSQLSQSQNVTAGSRRLNLLPEHQPLTLDTNIVTRPLTDSYFSQSSNTGSFDFTDLSAFSEVPSFASASSSDYTPRSSLLSSTPLSPIPSPRHTLPELVRGGNRARASPSPRASVRAPPHSFDGVRKRWSTGSSGPRPNRVTSPFLTQNHAGGSGLPSPSMRQNRSVPLMDSSRQQPRSRNLVHFQGNNNLLPSNFDANARFRNPASLASQGVFRTLQSDTVPHQHYFDHYSEFPGPPDLLGPLKEERVLPPPEDMMPSDPSMKPYEQDLRFENDLYTPKWVRGHGNKREGWCGICKPGRWLVLKNSAFWYDKSFTHGISAPTGQAFAPPRDTRRTDGNTNVWEGLCGNCDEWIALVSSKKKGTTWFRHAYKCHNHPKNETLKRHRENTPSNGNPPTPDSRPRSSPQTVTRKVEPATSTKPSPAPELPGGGPKSLSPLHTVATRM